MTTSEWNPFPYPNDDYRFADGALKKRWERLHRGDREPYPGAEYFARLCKAHPQVRASIPGFDGDYKALAEKIRQAWRLYHQGDFQESAKLALSLGLPGYAVANKATAIYANYLEKNPATRLRLFEEVAARCEEAAAAMPEHANSHYLRAYALGRYSQGISVIKALAQGLGGKVKESLERTLKLAPDHAEAHIALGTYHAEILDKVGTLVGALTYGADRDEGLEHFRRALELTPGSPIARIEYANGLLMMYGASRIDEATGLYVEASALAPMDAMERLDVELAKSRLD